jgi:uncharacterized protein YajQ (UPF0234 family)
MPSFDVVSKVNMHEVANAVDQTCREITTRYDFKGSKATVDHKDTLIEITVEDNMKLKAIQDILRQKLAKREVSLKSVTFEEAKKVGGDMLKQEVIVKQGLTSEELKRLTKIIKADKIKVTAQIQDEQLRVSGNKRDDLQMAISLLKTSAPDLELQFINFRD